MATDITVLHLTDCHLLAEPGARLHGHDVAADFRRVLDAALADHPQTEAIVLGGDLVDDESVAGYRWLDAGIAAAGRSTLAIAGNHDDPRAMARHLTSAVVHDTLTLGAWRLIGLCSHRPALDSGRLGPAALDALAADLAAHVAPTLICIHHPPFDVGSAWIDGIGLVDREALRAVLGRHRHVRGILCGHVHQAVTTDLDGVPAWSTPATMRQFRPGSEEFAEDHQRGPGYRCLRLAPDGGITTTVHRLAQTESCPGPAATTKSATK